MDERFERQEKENEKIWQAIEQNTRAIEELRKAMKEGFERQEKENQRIWQAIEEMRKTMKEGFEKQAQENEKIWQAIKEGFERQEKENQRIWQAIDKLDKKMDRKITALGAKWGLMAEGTFRAGIKEIIEDLGYAVENVKFFDSEGYVF